MKNPVLRQRALERLYRKALRLLHEDEAKFEIDHDIDFEKRAKDFVYSMSSPTLVLLAIYVQESYGFEVAEDFMWLMPPTFGMAFAMQATFDRSPVY